jgi:hypothetical protein
MSYAGASPSGLVVVKGSLSDSRSRFCGAYGSPDFPDRVNRTAESPSEQLRERAAAAWQELEAACEAFITSREECSEADPDPELVAAVSAAYEKFFSLPPVALIPTEEELNAMTPEEEARWAGVPWHEQPAPVVGPAPVPRRPRRSRPRTARRRIRVRSGSRGDPPSPSDDDPPLASRAEARRLGVLEGGNRFGH